MNGQAVHVNGQAVHVNGQAVHVNGQAVYVNGQAVHVNGQAALFAWSLHCAFPVLFTIKMYSMGKRPFLRGGGHFCLSP